MFSLFNPQHLLLCTNKSRDSNARPGMEKQTYPSLTLVVFRLFIKTGCSRYYIEWTLKPLDTGSHQETIEAENSTVTLVYEPLDLFKPIAHLKLRVDV